MNKNYRVVDHTADLSVLVRGSGLDGLFTEAARAMIDLICSIESVKPEKKFNIKVTGSSGEQLLVNVLQEILYFHEVRNFVFCEFTIIRLTGSEVTGIARGEKYDTSRHELLNHIKAVTYNNMRIIKRGRNYETFITFDI